MRKILAVFAGVALVLGLLSIGSSAQGGHRLTGDYRQYWNNHSKAYNQVYWCYYGGSNSWVAGYGYTRNYESVGRSFNIELRVRKPSNTRLKVIRFYLPAGSSSSWHFNWGALSETSRQPYIRIWDNLNRTYYLDIIVNPAGTSLVNYGIPAGAHC